MVNGPDKYETLHYRLKSMGGDIKPERRTLKFILRGKRRFHYHGFYPDPA